MRQLTYDIVDLISHLTLRKIGLTEIKTLSPPMGIQLLTRIYNVLYIKGSREKQKESKFETCNKTNTLYIYIYTRIYIYIYI